MKYHTVAVNVSVNALSL